ncbi:MAG: hypothetical protein J6R93_01945 [Tidjanibacter sp.]|nr:hypothetical protein [Tidjanibacter sp.]
MKRNIKNILLSLIGFSAAPMLTACYGTPDFSDEYQHLTGAEGYVVNEKLEPISGIQVEAMGQKVLSNSEGRFTFLFDEYTWADYLTFTATDVDGKKNGEYKTQEVTVSASIANGVSIVMSEK